MNNNVIEITSTHLLPRWYRYWTTLAEIPQEIRAKCPVYHYQDKCNRLNIYAVDCQELGLEKAKEK